MDVKVNSLEILNFFMYVVPTQYNVEMLQDRECCSSYAQTIFDIYYIESFQAYRRIPSEC